MSTLVRSTIIARFGIAGSGLLLSLIGVLGAAGQQVTQNPSPMADTTRPHPRIEKVEVPGRRIELTALRGAVLFVGPKVKTDNPVPLIVHFHGVPWLK